MAFFSSGNVKKAGSSSFFTSPNTYDSDSVLKSIDNAQLRIQDAGFKVEDADQRNWFEKATNLPQNQNFLFDTLELLGRGGQAIMNPINKAIKGEEQNVASSFFKGLSGKEKVRGSEIAEGLGVENKIGKAVLGTALDIGLDPLTFVPGGVLLKGAKLGAKAAAAPIKGAYNLAEKASPNLKKLREEVIQPTLETAKDKLGYAFNDDYKATETLSGGKSDMLLSNFNNSEAKRRYLQQDFADKLTDTAKTTGVEAGEQVGRVMESGLKQFDDAGTELSRTVREIPNDPKITQAAESLMKSNAELRGLAESEGIPINELEGYMTHILSREEKARRKLKNVNTIDRGNFGLGQPNNKILNQRELKGSAEDVNELTGRKFFEPNAYFATAQGQRRLIDYVQSVSFRKNVLNDPDFAQAYTKGDIVPSNAVVIDTNNYKFIKESGDILEGVANKDIGGQYIVTKAAKQKLDKYKYTMTDEGSKAFLNTFDALQSFWKRAALFSVPYHLRNDVGAKFNNWVGGMNAADIAKYSKEADVDVFNAMIKGKESPLYNEYRQQGLGATSQSQVEFARRGADPDKAVEKMVREGSKSIAGKAKDRLNPLRAFETSREFGDFVDQTNRFAAYKWAREKLKLSPEEAAKKTKELQFDYTKLSNFERDFASRAIPFYRWMRNNIPYQIRQFLNDPRKYEYANKLRLNAQDAAGIDEENIPDWMKESFSIPVTSDGKGSGKMLGFNLPLGDLTKLNNPLKMGIDSLSPVAKLPLELGINRNLFYNKPIEKFEGQAKKFNVLGQEFNVAIKTAYALEQATGQIGRGLSGFLTKPEEADQDTKFRMPSFGISGVLKDFDANKATYFQLRNKLKELQDYISYIEQQTGERPRTVNDINKEQTSSSFFRTAQ